MYAIILLLSVFAVHCSANQEPNREQSSYEAFRSIVIQNKDAHLISHYQTQCSYPPYSEGRNVLPIYTLATFVLPQ